jgi:hypothetical protein
MRRILFSVIISIFLLSFILTGCQSTGISQDSYDKLKSQYDEVVDKYEALTSATGETQTETPDISKEMEAVLAENAELQEQIDELVDKYVLEGATPAETAENVVRYYHETHVYDATDMFVCADMAAEVWNMLKAHGISALITVGDLDRQITDIAKCDHSWVLAEIGPGEYLALETTGGVVKPRGTNPEYYRGWTFDTPADEKDWQSLVREYNIRVEIVNDIVSEAKKAEIEYYSAVDIYNQLAESGPGGTQLEDQEDIMKKWLTIKNKLNEIKESMEEELYNIRDQMESLATQLF